LDNSLITNDFTTKKMQIQGHRGARGLLPENTIESCIEAVKCGVAGIEIDVVVSKDGQIVVSHEPWMSPQICSYPNGQAVKPFFTEGVKSLLKMDYAEIKQYDCGSRGHPKFQNQKPLKAYKPTLYELVSSVYAYCETAKVAKPFFNIEIKSLPIYYRRFVPPPNEFVTLLKYPLSILPENSFYISSFDPQVLRVVKRELPKISLAFLTENILGLSLNIRRLGFIPQMYSPYYRFLSLKMVKKAHYMGMKVVTWTVNDVQDFNRLRNMGVDGVITDYPNVAANFNSP
jgi:glycerophosphoryl diester phosphodiesterase